MAQALFDCTTDLQITEYSFLINFIHNDIFSKFIGVGQVISISRNSKRKRLIVIKRIEHIVFIVSRVVNGQLDHFLGIEGVNLCVDNFIGFYFGDGIFATHALFQESLIFPIDLFNRIICEPFFTAHFKIPNVIIRLLAGIHLQVIFLRFLLQIIAVVIDYDAFIIGNNNGVICQGYLADGKEKVIGVEDCVQLVVFISQIVPQIQTTVRLKLFEFLEGMMATSDLSSRAVPNSTPVFNSFLNGFFQFSNLLKLFLLLSTKQNPFSVPTTQYFLVNDIVIESTCTI